MIFIIFKNNKKMSQAELWNKSCEQLGYPNTLPKNITEEEKDRFLSKLASKIASRQISRKSSRNSSKGNSRQYTPKLQIIPESEPISPIDPYQFSLPENGSFTPSRKSNKEYNHNPIYIPCTNLNKNNINIPHKNDNLTTKIAFNDGNQTIYVETPSEGNSFNFQNNNCNFSITKR